MSAIQSVKHAVAVRVGWPGSNTAGGAAVLVVGLDVDCFVFFRGIPEVSTVQQPVAQP